MYTTKKIKVFPTSELDMLASESGRVYSKVVSLIRKAELAGLKVKFVSEAYTSQTCPRCGNRKKPANRNYHCNHCGFEYHRDGVGAINLWNKVLGFSFRPVVGAMVSPIGVRFDWHLCKSG